MKIVMFCHPAFLPSQSMPRFSQMLKIGYEARGHQVEMWAAQPCIFKLMPAGRLSKWAGYVDQHVLFPLKIRKVLKRRKMDTLYVFCDQALGPWVPLVDDLPNVIHVHDLLALRSALGEIPENRTSITGRIYQRFIRRGFRRGRHFISVSKKTRDDLHRIGQVSPVTSQVVYNGLNYPYAPLTRTEWTGILHAEHFPAAQAGVLLHVGGGQWYKNLGGVVALYAQYAARNPQPLSLWCIGPAPNCTVRAALRKVPPMGRVLFFHNVENRTLQALYSMARALIFPSLAEGFGWPLVEAQACGCAVITTDEAPMNEIGGASAAYLPRLRMDEDLDTWAANGAAVLEALLAESAAKSGERRQRGREWAARFSADEAIDNYLAIYERVLISTTAQEAVR